MPQFAKIAPQRVEFFNNNSLSDTGYSIGQLTSLYLHYLDMYWHRFVRSFHNIEVTVMHITYWRSQLRWLGSDLVRRGWITVEELHQHICFRHTAETASQQSLRSSVRKGRDRGNSTGPNFFSRSTFGDYGVTGPHGGSCGPSFD